MTDSNHPGDRQVVAEINGLPAPAAAAAHEFVRRIRGARPGFYKRMKSGQYNYDPDNFFAIVVQPRIGSIRVTVYGKPNSFGRTSAVTLTPSQTSYTQFNLRSPSEVDEAVRIALKAADLKQEYQAAKRPK